MSGTVAIDLAALRGNILEGQKQRLRNQIALDLLAQGMDVTQADIQMQFELRWAEPRGETLDALLVAKVDSAVEHMKSVVSAAEQTAIDAADKVDKYRDLLTTARDGAQFTDAQLETARAEQAAWKAAQAKAQSWLDAHDPELVASVRYGPSESLNITAPVAAATALPVADASDIEGAGA